MELNINDVEFSGLGNLLVLEQFLASRMEIWLVPRLGQLELPWEYLQLKLLRVMTVFVKGPSVMILWSVFYLEAGWRLSAQEERPMMCLSQLDRWPAQRHWPDLLESGALDEAEKTGLLGSRALDEAEKMVLFSVALAGFWCFLGTFS